MSCQFFAPVNKSRAARSHPGGFFACQFFPAVVSATEIKSFMGWKFKEGQGT
jgi:hypothetical protein